MPSPHPVAKQILDAILYAYLGVSTIEITGAFMYPLIGLHCRRTHGTISLLSAKVVLNKEVTIWDFGVMLWALMIYNHNIFLRG